MESIIIIGAGIAGLSAGCYGRMNGYRTQIFELHDKPGGLCTSWKRSGQSSSERRPSPYVRRLLAAFARELDATEDHDLKAQYVRLTGITPLTRRELELLDLLAQRLTYREIGERLVISLNTVKRHVSNIYGKLGVSKRRQAIVRAQEVGLLSPA